MDKPTHLLIRLSIEEKKKLKELANNHHLSMASFLKMKALTNNN
jgi:hypothetical protein